MEQNIYCGRGTNIPYEDFMGLINLTFGFTTPETQFLGLLPKLYREEYRPQDSNYVVVEDGTLCAAVGAYDHSVTVCGETLTCRGIGNVAVHPDHRSKGYMKMAMEAAIDGMIEDEIAISSLGGRRQRYQYFSYDRCGPCYNFTFNQDNLRQVFKDTAAPFDGYRVITDARDPMIPAIHAIAHKGKLSPNRPMDRFLDICNTWHCKLIAVTHGGALKGYAVAHNGDNIIEVRAADPADFLPLLRTLLVNSGGNAIQLCLPPFEHEAIAGLAPVCEGVTEGCSMMYTVLNYQKVIRAFLRLKASYTKLPDGEISLFIEGRGGPERLRITVRNQYVTVEPIHHSVAVDLALTHMNAMNVLFAPVSPMRNNLPPLFREWFPLPLWVYRADEV